MATRVRRDIQTAVAFLMARVKNPDEDDWGKLKRVLKYLNGTKYLKLWLSVDNLGLLKWFIDVSHNTHWDCKGHGGAMFTMGRGATTSYSRQVKLNSRSSTETELLTSDMYMLITVCAQSLYAYGDPQMHVFGGQSPYAYGDPHMHTGIEFLWSFGVASACT